MFDPKKISPQFFDDLAKKLSSVLPDSLQNLKQDVEKNFKAILTAAFSKMDLVTREEFDAQVQVLERTRAKVEQLSALVSELEKKQTDTDNKI